MFCLFSGFQIPKYTPSAIDCILGGPHTQDIPKFEVPMRKDML